MFPVGDFLSFSNLVFGRKLPPVPPFFLSLTTHWMWSGSAAEVAASHAKWKCKCPSSKFIKNLKSNSRALIHVQGPSEPRGLYDSRDHSCDTGPTCDSGRVANHPPTSLGRRWSQITQGWPFIVSHCPGYFYQNPSREVISNEAGKERTLFPLGWVVQWTDIYWVPTMCQAQSCM